MSHHCPCSSTSAPERPVDQALIEIMSAYSPNQREYLIPILQDTQHHFTYLSKDSMIEIARYVRVAVSKVYGVVTFYNQFKLTPPGKHLIQVCRGTACHVRGSDKILKAFESELSLKAGQTSKDNLYSLDIVACIGSCSIAPVITVDGIFHGRLIPRDVEKILATTRAEEKK